MTELEKRESELFSPGDLKILRANFDPITRAQYCLLKEHWPKKFEERESEKDGEGSG